MAVPQCSIFPDARDCTSIAQSPVRISRLGAQFSIVLGEAELAEQLAAGANPQVRLLQGDKRPIDLMVREIEGTMLTVATDRQDLAQFDRPLATLEVRVGTRSASKPTTLFMPVELSPLMLDVEFPVGQSPPANPYQAVVLPAARPNPGTIGPDRFGLALLLPVSGGDGFAADIEQFQYRKSPTDPSRGRLLRDAGNPPPPISAAVNKYCSIGVTQETRFVSLCENLQDKPDDPIFCFVRVYQKDTSKFELDKNKYPCDTYLVSDPKSHLMVLVSKAPNNQRLWVMGSENVQSRYTILLADSLEIGQVAVADVNSDGFVDVINVDDNFNCTIWRQDADHQLTIDTELSQTFTRNFQPLKSSELAGVAIADMDWDGLADLMLVTNRPQNVILSMFPYQGKDSSGKHRVGSVVDMSRAVPPAFQAIKAGSMVIGDVNQDGSPDVLLVEKSMMPAMPDKCFEASSGARMAVLLNTPW